jgi:hypothetical protein
MPARVATAVLAGATRWAAMWESTWIVPTQEAAHEGNDIRDMVSAPAQSLGVRR